MELVKVKNILGYGNKLNEMRKAKLMKTLDKYYKYNGIILHSYEFIINKILEGARPKFEENYSYYSKRLDGYTKPKTLYMISIKEENSYNEISKTEHNFAEWLVKNDIITVEKVREFEVLEDNRVKEIERLEVERIEKECQEKLRKEQEEKEFNNWLESKWKLYNNVKNLELAKTIYMDRFGEYIERSAKILLTLIDNINNNKCKDKLIDWLGIHNPTSRKLFYHVSGIKLPSTNRDTRDLLKNISSSDFKGLIKYKKKNKTQPKELKKIYIKRNNEIILAEGEEFKNNFDMQLYLVYSDEKGYLIVEEKTGMSVISGENKALLIKDFKNRVTEDIASKLKIQIEKIVNDKGELPKVI